MPTITRKEMIAEDVRKSLRLDKEQNSELTKEYRDWLARTIQKQWATIKILQEELDVYNEALEITEHYRRETKDNS